MARTVELKIGADSYELRPSWAASVEVAEKLQDPLTMAIRASRGEDVLDSRGVVKMIWIGLKHGGHEFTEDEVGELLMQNGLSNFVGVAGEFLAALVNNGPEKKAKAAGKKK